MAGFNQVSGDIIVCMDDDEQTPGNEVGKLLEKIEEGYDVAYARYVSKKHLYNKRNGMFRGIARNYK